LIKVGTRSRVQVNSVFSIRPRIFGAGRISRKTH
jgi:hypothetical protein